METGCSGMGYLSVNNNSVSAGSAIQWCAPSSGHVCIPYPVDGVFQMILLFEIGPETRTTDTLFDIIWWMIMQGIEND